MKPLSISKQKNGMPNNCSAFFYMDYRGLYDNDRHLFLKCHPALYSESVKHTALVPTAPKTSSR